MSTTKPSSAVDSKVRPNQTRSGPDEAVAGLEESGHSLDKVRDILFGQNMRTYEERLALLERRVQDEVQQLRDNADAKFQHLESLFRKELDALGQLVKAERDERNTDVQGLQKEMQGAAEVFERRLGELDSQMKQSGDGLSNQLRDQTEALKADLQQTSSEITTRLDHEVTELRAAKPDTAALATLFAELADRLRDHPPSAD